MDTQSISGVLNELLALEQGNLATRLLESIVFASRLSTDGLATVQDMAQASKEHGAWLADVILELGGVPGLRTADVRTADLHYVEINHALPRLVADHEAMIRKYALATERVAADPRATQIVSRIAERHRADLASLGRLGGQNVAS